MGVGRDYQKQMLHYLRKSIVYGDDDVLLTVGYLPAGSLIVQPLSGVYVQTAFNAATGNVLQIGADADPNYFATSLALGTVAFVPLDVSRTVELIGASEVKVTATVELTGTAATAGAAEVVICYIPDNDG